MVLYLGAYVSLWICWVENTRSISSQKPLVSCLINLNGFIQIKLCLDYVTECKGVGAYRATTPHLHVST